MRSALKSLFGRRSSLCPELSPDGTLRSDLWVDSPAAHDEVEERLRRASIDETQAEKLHHFVDHGYLTFSLDLDDRLFAGIDADVEELWRRKPRTVAFALHGPLQPFADSVAEVHRKPSHRIADLHSFSSGALELFLHREIFDWVELIFEQAAVATQSLYFEYGSQQPLHRDPVHVYHQPPTHLMAAWIALEDVSPHCGPLTYVSGSHRLPYYRFEGGDYKFKHGTYTDREAQAMADFEQEQARRRGLEARPFTCRRGEVLLWHHSLLHGGSQPTDPALTRKSFVVHYATLANQTLSRRTIRAATEEGQPEDRVVETARVLERDGCHGFANPLTESETRDRSS